MRAACFRRLAAYNLWANGRLYGACGALADAEYLAARPAFFGSIHRTLNHVLLADRMWLARLRGEAPISLPLDTELYTDREGLRKARLAQDAVIIDYVEGLSETDYDRALSYRNFRGEPFTNGIAAILQHLFNHQTHHRGQVHGMLSATSVPPPPLDLIYFERLNPELLPG